MANQVAPMVKLIQFLDAIIGTYYAGATLRLYSNNYTPITTSAAGNFTECAFAGYAGQVINAWGASYDAGGGIAECDHPQKTFSCTGAGGNIWGYYITTPGGLLVAAQQLSGVFAIVNGQFFLVTPEVRLENM
jgi:hypothetical protein